MEKEYSKDIRYENYFRAIKWENSPMLFVFTWLFAIMYFLCIVQIITRCIKKRGRHVYVPILVDCFLFIFLTIQVLSLIFYKTAIVLALGYYASLYLLFDFLASSLQTIFLSPLIHNGEIAVNNSRRWILTTIVTAFQAIISFSLIILCNGDAFVKGNMVIETPLESLYYSTTTFTTLGYGDYVPKNSTGMIIVLLELFFFALFFVLKLPAAIGAIKLREIGRQ